MLQGSMVALITPFKNKEVDYSRLESLIEFHLAQGTDAFVLLGTTAETPCLAGDEKESLLRFAISRIKGKKPIIVGTGTNTISTTVSSSMQAEKLGAEYALIVTPYYNKPTQEGLYQYYKTIVERTNLPIILYNVPGRTGVNMNAETTIRLANDFPGRIVGLKDASANLVQSSEILRDAPNDFFVLCGEDALNYPLMACGAKGTISVTANIVPAKMHALTEAALHGNYDLANQYHLELLELNNMMFIESNPIPVKEALAMMKMIELEFRLPLCPMQESNRNKLHNCLERYKLV